MNLAAIEHRTEPAFVYAEAEDQVTIRLRTAAEDVRHVTVFYGDRVAVEKPAPLRSLSMERVASDGISDWYEVTFITPWPRLFYDFLLEDRTGEEVYFSPLGGTENHPADRTWFFQLPYIRREELVREPAWISGRTMYHIFPDSFASGERGLADRKKEIRRDDGGISRSLHGGTLKGITESLSYLKDLGIGILYLNPVFTADTPHHYDVADYYHVDPCLGTNRDMKELVNHAHELDIRVILDGVFNHCGPSFFAFRDVLKRGKDSPFLSWFYDMETPVVMNDPPQYACFAYEKHMPKLNTGNPDVRDYFCDVGASWIREMGIDGWRLDVANEIDHTFLRAFHEAVRREKPDAFLVAEVWEDAEGYLTYDQFDSTMDYPFTYLCRSFFAERSLSAEQFDRSMQRALMRYPWPVSAAQMNFLDSHDVPRFLSLCGGDRRRLHLAMFYLLTMPGVPSIFYGDECFLEGMQEQEYRRPMDWSCFDPCGVGPLIRLRRSTPVLTKGKVRTLLAKGQVLVLERYTEDTRAVMIYNNQDISVHFRREDLNIPAGGFVNAMTNEALKDELLLQPMEGLLFLENER